MIGSIPVVSLSYRNGFTIDYTLAGGEVYEHEITLPSSVYRHGFVSFYQPASTPYAYDQVSSSVYWTRVNTEGYGFGTSRRSTSIYGYILIFNDMNAFMYKNEGRQSEPVFNSTGGYHGLVYLREAYLVGNTLKLVLVNSNGTYSSRLRVEGIVIAHP